MADTFVKNPKLIVGTQAQIESEISANDIGFATDVEFYTKNQIDELLESSVNSKADADLGNIPANYDYVVESQEPTADNAYTWYRKYKSGWVEQGGANCASNTAVVFPVPMADNNYTAYAIANFASGITQAMAIQVINNRTTTSMLVASFSVGGYTVDWQISGMSA